MFLSDAYLGIYFNTRTTESCNRLRISEFPEIKLSLYNDLGFSPIIVAKKGADYDDPLSKIPMRFLDWHVYEVKTSIGQNAVEIFISKSKHERTVEDLILKGFDMTVTPHRLTSYLSIHEVNPKCTDNIIIDVVGSNLNYDPRSKYTLYVTSVDRSKYSSRILGCFAAIAYPKDFAKIKGAYYWLTYRSTGQIGEVRIMVEDLCETYADDTFSDVKMKWKFKSICAPAKSYTRKGAKKQKESKDDGTSKR